MVKTCSVFLLEAGLVLSLAICTDLVQRGNIVESLLPKTWKSKFFFQQEYVRENMGVKIQIIF